MCSAFTSTGCGPRCNTMTEAVRGVRRIGEHRYAVTLPDEEREFLRSLAPQMRELLDEGDPDPDPARARLFPVAYPADEDRQTEYRLLVHDELRASHVAALDALEAGLQADELDEEALDAWIRAINQVRLVVGTQLGITEEGDERPSSRRDARTPMFGVYDYLTWLQDEIIDALSDE